MLAQARLTRRLQRDPGEGALMNKRQETDPLVIGGITLTGPITITVVKTVGKTDTVSTTLSSLPTTSLSSTTTSSSSRPRNTRSTTPPLEQTASASSPSTLTSNVPPTRTPTSTDIPARGALSRSSGLSPGDIAGIIIGIFLLLAIPIFFFMFRRRLLRNRRANLQRRWSFSPGVMMDSAGLAGVSLSAAMGNSAKADSEKAGFSDDPYGGIESNSRQLTSLSISHPTSTYSNGSMYTSLSTPYSAGVYSTSSNGRSPYPATVNFTFLPTKDDELSIRFGDTLRVLAEYDDGWALCSKPNGEQGMVPLECLSDSTGAGGGQLGVSGSPGAGGSSLTVPSLMGERRASARASSLGPQAQAWKDYRT